ncbi:hypothetical protein [Kiloniella sp.]|uniref:hypothetical protein n=1 Tax=Kiloniella sp. TaxID=1938587 RepID=UPI003B017A5C
MLIVIYLLYVKLSETIHINRLLGGRHLFSTQQSGEEPKFSRFERLHYPLRPIISCSGLSSNTNVYILLLRVINTKILGHLCQNHSKKVNLRKRS